MRILLSGVPGNVLSAEGVSVARVVLPTEGGCARAIGEGGFRAAREGRWRTAVLLAFMVTAVIRQVDRLWGAVKDAGIDIEVERTGRQDRRDQRGEDRGESESFRIGGDSRNAGDADGAGAECARGDLGGIAGARGAAQGYRGVGVGKGAAEAAAGGLDDPETHDTGIVEGPGIIAAVPAARRREIDLRVELPARVRVDMCATGVGETGDIDQHIALAGGVRCIVKSDVFVHRSQTAGRREMRAADRCRIEVNRTRPCRGAHADEQCCRRQKSIAQSLHINLPNVRKRLMKMSTHPSCQRYKSTIYGFFTGQLEYVCK